MFAIWVGFLVGFDFVVAGFDWGLMLPLTPFGGLWFVFGFLLDFRVDDLVVIAGGCLLLVLFIACGWWLFGDFRDCVSVVDVLWGFLIWF